MNLSDRHTPRADRAGLTMLELMVTMVVLLFAVGGTLGSLSSFVVLGDSARETTVATQAAKDMLEQLRTETFGEVFARYNDSAADDPGGVSPGADFAVLGLDPRRDDADGLCGEILFPVDDAAPTVLREDLDANEFGLPRDLDGDQVTDANDRSGDYQLLPVVVRIRWRGASGNRQLQLATVLRNGGAQ